MVPFGIGGTALFAIGGLIMLPFRDRLDANGHSSWIGICVAGALLGLVGLSVMIVHDRNRRRRLAQLDPDGVGRE